MGSEAGLRNTLKKKLKGICHYVRVENSCETGTPDVNLAWKGVIFASTQCEKTSDSCDSLAKSYSVWIELKYLAAFPKRKTTKVTLSCFTLDQITWLLARIAVKKHGSWLLVQVSTEYYLFTARAAAKVYYGVNTNEFKELASWTGNKGWVGRELLASIERVSISEF